MEPGEIDAAVRMFMRSLEFADNAKLEQLTKIDAAYRSQPPVTYSEVALIQVSFQPLPNEEQDQIVDGNVITLGCTCSLDELWSVWKSDDRTKVTVVVTHIVTDVPDERRLCRACLRFAGVMLGTVKPYTDLSDSATAVLSTLTDGCYAVQFYGTCAAYNSRDGKDRDFQPSTVDFIVYKLTCDEDS